MTLIDGMIVVGGGLSKAGGLILDALTEQLNSSYAGNGVRKVTAKVYNLEDEQELEEFMENQTKTIKVPGLDKELKYTPIKKIGIGLSRLGTSVAISVGAYAFALNQLDHNRG